MNQVLFDWILAVIGSGGLGAAITYLCTIGSRRKKEAAAAENVEVDVELKKLNLRLDLYDFLLKTCDKYIKDYHELEGDFRKQISDIRNYMDDVMREKSKAISDKCNEIAALKSEVTYLKGIRCYNFTCQHRIRTNPDKQHK